MLHVAGRGGAADSLQPWGRWGGCMHPAACPCCRVELSGARRAAMPGAASRAASRAAWRSARFGLHGATCAAPARHVEWKDHAAPAFAASQVDGRRQLEHRINLACALLRSGQRARAKEVSEAALQELQLQQHSGGELTSLEYALRVNLSCASDPAARKMHLLEASRLEPWRVEAKFHLAAVLEEEGDLDAALQALHQALKLAPEDLGSLALACRCLERLDRHAEALAAAEQLCRVDPASTFLALREVFRCQPEDVFVVTFPRCGTTWMVQIAVSCLFDPHANYEEHATFLEGSIASSASYVRRLETLPRPRVLKTHVPAEMYPGLGGEGGLQDHGKVLYVVRNPKDALVSLRHHHANNKAIGWEGSWDEWVRRWLAGERSAEYGGSYFEHVKGWWQLAKQHPDRVRIFYFEEMKADLMGQVAAVSSFLGRPHLPLAEADGRCYTHGGFRDPNNGRRISWRATRASSIKVCAACSFDSMRGRHEVAEDIRSRVNPNHFRAGQVGSWREVLTPAQASLVDEMTWKHLGPEIREGLRITDLPEKASARALGLEAWRAMELALRDLHGVRPDIGESHEFAKVSAELDAAHTAWNRICQQLEAQLRRLRAAAGGQSLAQVRELARGLGALAWEQLEVSTAGDTVHSLEESQRRCENLSREMVRQAQKHEELVAAVAALQDTNRRLVEQIRFQGDELQAMAQQQAADERRKAHAQARQSQDFGAGQAEAARQLGAAKDMALRRSQRTRQQLGERLRQLRGSAQLQLQ
ncbi:unnamed protein product, partial [Effrenium voratum]